MTAKKKKAREVIAALEKGKLKAVCPHCDEDFKLADAGLFALDDFTREAEQLYEERLAELKERKKELASRRKDVSARSERGAEAVNIGLVLERLAPALDSFGFARNDCRSLFDPIDYVIGPKALAMTLVMPMLSGLFICAGIFGGYLVGVGLMGIDSGTYLTAMESSINFRSDVSGSILKALLFGVLVGLVSTYRGYNCAPTSAGVSAATTSTVVTASVAVLISDYFFTALWGV